MGYTLGMKTAISIPDDVFEAAERLAHELGQTRSALYARAVREYVARHTPDSVTATLDALFAEGIEPDTEFSSSAARRTFERSDW